MSLQVRLKFIVPETLEKLLGLGGRNRGLIGFSTVNVLAVVFVSLVFVAFVVVKVKMYVPSVVFVAFHVQFCGDAELF